MQENDTVKLLRECDAGIKMAVSSIDEILDNVRDKELKNVLITCKSEHSKLQTQVQVLLAGLHDEGKEPNPMAKGMSWIKTNAKLAFDDSDKTTADLMTDGCGMGIKSLNRYLNQYKAADEVSKDITKQLIALEEKLNKDLQKYL